MRINQQTIYSVTRGAAIAAAGFILIVAILMITNYLQTKAMDPLNSKPLETLMKNLEQNPADQELRDQIRALDLLSRKAYFVSQWQLRTGAYFLLGGVIVLLTALKTMNNLRKKLPSPEGVPDENETWLMSSKARQWIAGLGIVLFGSALIFAGFSYREISNLKFDSAISAPTKEDFLKNWPTFRGPGSYGIARTEQAPTSWDVEKGQGIKWKTAVPKPGHNSPIVWENQVFLSGGDKESLEVYCFDAEIGTILWQRQVNDPADADTKTIKLDSETGYAAPTMATNGRYVFAIFATGDIACLDMSGNQIWKQNLGVPDNHYGHSSSLLVYENLLIVQYDQHSNSMLLALDVLSGNTAWRVNRSVISWSSPICVDTGDRMELIVTNSRAVDSYDPKTGVKLWEKECLSGEHGPSPAYVDGIVFVANEYSSGTALRIGETDAEILWEFYDELPDAASPLINDKFVFIATSYGYVVCLDLKTGKMLWDQEFEEGFYASPILVGNLVYAMDRKGVMHIFEADKEFKSVGDYAFGETMFSTPAFVGNKIYIRGEKNLFCITGS